MISEWPSWLFDDIFAMGLNSSRVDCCHPSFKVYKTKPGVLSSSKNNSNQKLKISVS